MKLYEMEGFIRGKCIPGDLKVNETNAEYLVRKFSEAEERCAELSARLSMINGLIEAAEQANKLAQEATETLVQERNALAAENAALKYQEPTLTAMMSCLDAFYADEDVPERAMMAAYNILRKSISTPDTDAFLAEVRAHGVEMFAAHCQKRHGEMLKTEPNEPISNGAITATRRAGEFALYFAAQLRKGAQS